MFNWALNTNLCSTEMKSLQTRSTRTASMESLKPPYEKLLLIYRMN